MGLVSIDDFLLTLDFPAFLGYDSAQTSDRYLRNRNSREFPVIIVRAEERRASLESRHDDYIHILNANIHGATRHKRHA